MANDSPLKPTASKALMFNWNGHLWDAYEVLGVSDKATAEEVMEAYQEQVGRLNEDSRAFVTMAYELIMEKHKSSD